MDAKSTSSESLRVDITPYVGPAIRSFREQLSLSQEQLADAAELDRTYISGIERSRRNPSVLSLQKVAAAMGLSLELIFVKARKLHDEALSN